VGSLKPGAWYRSILLRGSLQQSRSILAGFAGQVVISLPFQGVAT
jgi:hypothetical protein